MGSILKGVCKNCGYETEDLYYGGGFMNFTTCCDFPGIDKVKKVVEMKNILERKKINNDFPNFIFYDNKLLFDKKLQKRKGFHEWGKSKLYYEGYLCPKCNQSTFRFDMVGNWD